MTPSMLPVPPSRLRLTGGRVLIAVDPPPTTTGHLHLSRFASPPATGVVAAASRTYSTYMQRRNGKRRRITREVVVRPGDRVSFPPFGGQEWRHAGLSYRMFHATELLLLIGEPQAT